MRVNINPLIKSYGNRPDSYRDDPVAETELLFDFSLYKFNNYSFLNKTFTHSGLLKTDPVESIYDTLTGFFSGNF
jgi:hypothetical protein